MSGFLTEIPVHPPKALIPAVGTLETSPPAWAWRMLGSAAARAVPARMEGLSIQIIDADHFSLLTVRMIDAAALSAVDLERRTAQAYAAIAGLLETRRARHPLRFWNHIPDIHCVMEDGRSRYMVFNAGRFNAYAAWFGGPERFACRLPTASAVGHGGDDLVIHLLAGMNPGVAVDNPRQIPPYRYSKRFGPRPPCFARATILPESSRNSRLILIGGTASVLGEESVHPGDVRNQTHETLKNVAALIRLAVGTDDESLLQLEEKHPAWLRHCRSLRIYYKHRKLAPEIVAMVKHWLPCNEEIELMEADICRPELLVEMEGVAEI